VYERLPVDEDRHGDQGDHQDLQGPGQNRVAGPHDQRVRVQQDAEHQGYGRLLKQDPDQHLDPAQRDHPAEAGMGSDDEEERTGHEQ
jgi:hypothetical protein